MRTGQEPGQDGPIPWPCAEFFLAGRIPRDDEKGWAYRNSCAIGQPEIVRGPVQGRKCSWGSGPQTECEGSGEQPHGAGLKPGGTKELPPQAGNINHDYFLHIVETLFWH